MAAWIEPLDLQSWLIDAFAGSAEVFMFLALLAIAGMAAYFRMLNATLMIMFAIFTVIVASTVSGAAGIYFLVILLAGLIIANTITRVVR